jgi:S-disulfanyl-L-cysteine oxidoreductase SoxD
VRSPNSLWSRCPNEAKLSFCPNLTKSVLTRATIYATAVLLSATLSSATSAQPAAVRSTKDRVYSAAQAAEGRDVYDGRCKNCHTAISHTGAPFRANWDKKSLADLWDYMVEKMPKDAPGTLSEEEYTQVMAYVLRMNGMPAGTDNLSSDRKALLSIRIDAPVAKP